MMAGKLPKSQKVKRSHFRTDAEYLAAMRKQRPGDTEKAFLNRCARSDRYEERKRREGHA